MSEKNNNLTLKFLNLLWKVVLGIIIVMGAIFATEERLDRKIAYHPSIVSQQQKMNDIDKRLERIERKLDNVLDDKK